MGNRLRGWVAAADAAPETRVPLAADDRQRIRMLLDNRTC
jgi:hypothetical protein